MPENELRKLPSLLLEAREAAGLTQRELARLLGVHPTHLCGFERGRRRISQSSFLEQFASTLQLPTATLTQLRWALAHDQMVDQARQAGLNEVAAGLVSVALELERELEEAELAGVQQVLATALRSKRFLRSYSAGPAAPTRQEALP